MKPAAAPKSPPTSSAKGIVIHSPRSRRSQWRTAIDPTAPMRNWPRPPMLNSPALKPRAIPSPARINGVAYTSVDVQPSG